MTSNLFYVNYLVLNCIFLHVNLEMCVEHRLVVCLEGAMWTHMASNPRVDPHVSAEYVFVGGTIGAIGTGEWPLSCVKVDVFIQEFLSGGCV